jgi:hypothetical protein
MVGVSRNAVALATLVSLLLTYGCCAQQRHLNYTSKLAKASSSPWLPAKATWYGAPTGAGPDDNGRSHYTLAVRVRASDRISSGRITLIDVSTCRWCLRLQACEPVPVHVHGVLRQRAPLQGWYGVRRLLPGTLSKLWWQSRLIMLVTRSSRLLVRAKKYVRSSVRSHGQQIRG